MQKNDMLPGEHSTRPARARTAVPTYNLKILTGISRRNHERYSDDDQSRAQTETSKAKTPESDLHQSYSNPSSESTSATMSPSLNALQVSLTDEAVAAVEVKAAVSNSSTDRYDCFGLQLDPKGHFYAANKLYARGIWIGYLDPHRWTESFRGLPSWSELKHNHASFTPPFPPSEFGTPRKSRDAICRGCASKDSGIITFNEIHFNQRSKLVIMPMDGDDEKGVFCIMLPQKPDRSLRPLQAYRPYELTDKGIGDTFANDFMLLTLRNPDQEADTLEYVLKVLPQQELRGVERRLEKQPCADAGCGSARPNASKTKAPSTQLPEYRVTSELPNQDGLQIGEPVARKRRKASGVTITPTRRSMGRGQINGKDDGWTLQTLQNRDAPCRPKSSPQLENTPRSVEVISLDLTDEQTKSIQFIWTIKDDDTEHEFPYTLDECKSFRGLLTLLEEDTQAFPPVTNILARTKAWSLTYQGADGTNKAIVARKGSEVAFERLQTLLAQSPIWNDSPSAKIIVELRSLCLTDSACAS
ncbi:hypothetical protein BDW02DRAFT_633596 [Decorospora gaudefroyi]|uniref:Uncharacterized protein n=1 Tax=Decorospora gaudefroyi TaxID=184978 RepID=A0A6A5K344_9PLEO|nr:hypothetical protein BDW02DRAFT_633596 [Decorospora gaudefroyi]